MQARRGRLRGLLAALALSLATAASAQAPAALPPETDAAASAGETRARIGELEARLKAAQAAGDLAAMLAVREDYAALVERVAGPHSAQLASALDNLAALHQRLGRADRAAPLLERALAIREAALGPQHLDTATILDHLGGVVASLGQHERALGLLERALRIREEQLGGEHALTIASVGKLADLRHRTGRYDLAVPLAERTLAFAEKAFGPNDARTATTLNNLAVLHQKLGQYARALPLYERALAIGERSGGAGAAELNNLAGLYHNMGSFGRAVALFERAVARAEQTLGPEHPDTGIALLGLAEACRSLGQYERSLALAERAVALIDRTLGATHPQAAASRRTLAAAYFALGRYDRAQSLLEAALAIGEKTFGEHPVTAEYLNGLANVLLRSQQGERALPLQQRAVAIMRRTAGPAHPDTAAALASLGRLHSELGQPEPAQAAFDEALAIIDKTLGPVHPNAAAVLHGQAAIAIRRGDFRRALPLLGRADEIAVAAAWPELQIAIAGALRRARAGLGERDLAIFHGKRAVNAAQALRAQARSLPADLRQALLGSKQEHYRALADLLLDAGRIGEAQHVLAMLKEDEYHEFIRRDAGSDPRTTTIVWSSAEAGFAAEFAALARAAAALADEAQELEVRHRAAPTEAVAARRQALQGELDRLAVASRQLLERLGSELPAAQARLLADERRQQQALIAGARGQLEGLDERVALIHYLVLGDRVRTVVTTRDSVGTYEAKIAEADLLRAMLAFRRSAEDPEQDVRRDARRLYDLLIAPAAGELERQRIRSLLLSLDGALRYLPFAALHDGRQFLVERYALSVHTAAAPAAIGDAPPPRWKLAGFGLTRAVEQFSALPGVAAELDGILGSQGMPGDALLDRDFTAAALAKALAGDYSAAHVASHFVFSPGNEVASFLLLGDGSRLTLRDLRQGDYRFAGLELLTLSACETAMTGGRDADGREFEGLATLARKKGARSVIATLWPIADQSTAELMPAFYRLREQGGLSKAEALRQAQLRLLRGNGDGQRAGFSHPFYWAPFVLMGSGR